MTTYLDGLNHLARLLNKARSTSRIYEISRHHKVTFNKRDFTGSLKIGTKINHDS